jgi:hypothetical protein
MAVENTLTTLNGLFKIAYAKKLENLLPSFEHVQRDISFVARGGLGELYRQPVILQGEHGVTYAASGDGAFALSAALAGKLAKADATGYQMLLRSAIDYEASFSGTGGETSFKDSTQLLFSNMRQTMTKRLEVTLLYGGMLDGIGTIESVSSNVLTITAASFADGIWAGSAGAEIDIFNAAGTTKRAGAGTGTCYTIVSVNLDTREITVDLGTNAVATDVIHFRTAMIATPTHKTAAGIAKIVSNTGTMFGISAVTYPDTWKGVTHGAGSTDFSLDTLQKGVAKLVARGADSDLVCYCNPVTWANVCNDQAALTRYSAEKTTYESGAVGIKLRSQVGSIDLKPHPYIKRGHALCISPKLFIRKGAVDVTFDLQKQGLPGEFFRHLSDNAGYEVRAFSHQFLFSPYPSRALEVNAIVNSA